MRIKLVLFVLVLLVAVAGKILAQDGSEYLLWEKTPGFEVLSQTFSNDESQLAVFGNNYNIIKILNTLNGDELYSITPQSKAHYGIYTNDGKYLIVRCSKETLVLDVKTYETVKSLEAGAISVSADSKYLALSPTGLNFKIINLENYQTVFEKSYTTEGPGESPGLEALFTPNGKYLIINRELVQSMPYYYSHTYQEIYDPLTFQKIDKTIKCLKRYGTLSDGDLVANTFRSNGDEGKTIGFRIYNYDKDSLIWEQKTQNYLIYFLKNTTYLISKYDNYEGGNPDMKVFKTWDLESKLRDKDIFCPHKSNSKISNTDKYLTAHNGVTIWLYDFAKMFDAVSVNEPNKSIEIIITNIPDSNLIKISRIGNEITKIMIYDLSGNLIDTLYKKQLNINSIEYNSSHLANGMYLIRIETDKETYTKKIIIE